MARTAHSACLGDDSKGVLQIDISNAFNTISRGAILEQCKAHFPAAFRWAQWSLCNAGTLVTDENSIPSTRGVQQGDPLGPFFFALGLHQVLKDLPTDVLNHYHLDDGLHHGALHALDKLLGWLEPNLKTIDLSLNVSKCHIFTRGDTSHFPNLRAVPVSSDGFEFLGAPIGTDQFVQSVLTTKFAKAIAFCGQVARLNDPPDQPPAAATVRGRLPSATSSEGGSPRCHKTFLSAVGRRAAGCIRNQHWHQSITAIPSSGGAPNPPSWLRTSRERSPFSPVFRNQCSAFSLGSHGGSQGAGTHVAVAA